MKRKLMTAPFTPFQLEWEKEKEAKKNQARREKRIAKSRIAAAIHRRRGY